MDVHRARAGERSLVNHTRQPAFFEEFLDPAQVHDLVFNAENIGEAALEGHALHHRQLAALEAPARRAGTRLLAFRALAGSRAMSGAIAPTDTLLVLIGAGIWAQIVLLHRVCSSLRLL